MGQSSSPASGTASFLRSPCGTLEFLTSTPPNGRPLPPSTAGLLLPRPKTELTSITTILVSSRLSLDSQVSFSAEPGLPGVLLLDFGEFMDAIYVDSLYPDDMGPKSMSLDEFMSHGLPLLDRDVGERVDVAVPKGNVLDMCVW